MSQGFSWGPVDDMEDSQEHIPIGPKWALGVSHQLWRQGRHYSTIEGG